MNTRQAAILGSSLLTPDKLPGLAAWYSADYGVLSQVGGGTAFASASSQRVYNSTTTDFRPAGNNFSACGWVWLNSLADVSKTEFLNFGGTWPASGGFMTLRVAADARLEFRLRSNDATAELFTTLGGFTAGAWHFFVVGRSGNNLFASINGGAVTSYAYTKTAADSTGGFLGARASTGVEVLDGKLDEVAYFGRALTSTEITWLYNSGAGRTYSEADDSLKTNLVSWWSMNAPASGDWLDQHGTNNLTPSASRPTATEGVTFNNATDGQTVRRWLDRSGNGRHLDQATLANQPTFSANRVVFNGTNSWMSVAAFLTGTGAKSIIAFYKPNRTIAANAICGQGTAGLNGYFMLYFRPTPTAGDPYFAGFSADVADGVAVNTNEKVGGVTWTGALLTLFRNGLQIGASSLSLNTGSSVFSVGSNPAASEFAQMNLAGIVVTTSALTHADMLKVAKWGAKTYGIAI